MNALSLRQLPSRSVPRSHLRWVLIPAAEVKALLKVITNSASRLHLQNALYTFGPGECWVTADARDRIANELTENIA